MTDIKFTTPPESRVGRPLKYVTPEIQTALRANPNEWALIGEAVADGVRSSVHHWVRKREDFEMTTRAAGKDVDGKPLFDIYVRHVAETES